MISQRLHATLPGPATTVTSFGSFTTNPRRKTRDEKFAGTESQVSHWGIGAGPSAVGWPRAFRVPSMPVADCDSIRLVSRFRPLCFLFVLAGPSDSNKVQFHPFKKRTSHATKPIGTSKRTGKLQSRPAEYSDSIPRFLIRPCNRLSQE